MRYIKTTIILLTAAVAILPGCQPEAQLPDTADSNRNNTEPSRIAVMAPAVAEILEALDAIDLIVAIGDFVEWPPQIRTLPQIGAYDKPNLELVLSLKVDLMVTARSNAGQNTHKRMRDLGVAVLELDTDTYDGVLESIEIVGELVGRQDMARRLVSDIRERIRKLKERSSKAPRRGVLFVVGQRPLYVAGPGSHIDLLIETAGGRNIFADAMSPYQLVSMEAALERMPEVIIDVSDNRPGARRGVKSGFWGQWKFLPAVNHNRVYWIDPLILAIPGPRMPEMAELLAKLIHPEIFGAVSDRDLESPGDDAR